MTESTTQDAPSPPFDPAYAEATEEKVHAAERNVAWIRAGVIVFNSLIFAFLLDPAETIPWLGWTIIGTANAYWIAVIGLEMYRWLPAITTSYMTSVLDATLITLWLLATGGFGSPFYVLWYVSIVAIAFRYDLTITLVVGVFYTACYSGLLAGTGELVANLTDVGIRSTYIFFVGAIGGLASRETMHQTEEKVRMRHLMEDARAAEERFRGLIESAPDAILIADRHGDLIMANTQAEHLFGVGRDELLETRFQALLPDLDADLGADPIRVAMGRQAPPDQPVRTQARRKDGGRVPIEMSVAPMATREGVLLSCILRDVSDRKRQERELERRNRELARSNEELQQFAYVASHDLQEPLRMVSSYVQLLERRYGDKLDEDAEVFIAYATEGVQRMHRLIQDLLAYSQVGVEERVMGPTDTKEIVDEVVTTLSPRIEETGAEIEIGELPVVVADRGQFVQVFQNLISNGLKFHREDATPRVRIDAEREGNDWVFSVQDNGIGIDKEYKEKVFVIFQRLHDRARYQGTGIGLAICKKVIEGHDGRIWFESPPSGAEHGTVFNFTLPVLRTAQASTKIDGAETATLDRSAPKTRLERSGSSDQMHA